MHFSQLAFPALLLFFSNYAEAKNIVLGYSGEWEISKNVSDTDGAFVSCVSMGEYKSGTNVFFSVSKNFDWAISFSGSRVRYRKGDRVSVYMNIDGSKNFIYQGYSPIDNMIRIGLPDSSDLFNNFRSGYRLNVSTSGFETSFNLTGTARMLTDLLVCAGNNAKADQQGSQRSAPPSSAPVGPQSSAKTTPAPKPSKGAAFGSGTFVQNEGTGLTNAHVVEGCTSATIEGYGRARITARDKTNDLALVQLTEPKRTESVQFARRSLKLGEFVYALGFPLPGIIDNGLNFTGGQVSSLSGLGGDTRHFQLSAPIQPGNSGGPVVNTSGQLVGVTRARLDDVATLEASGALPQNVNYAIRSDIAASFLRANGIDPSESEATAKLDPTDIATAGRGYTFQIRCTVE